ncbi:hypothetical protein [Anabaena sp. UHCC 0399]|uniref:hypothetical protein n=1 Tax=Anabaena sp. UHCC 0399 TaxID=3110238 RepID=UPI002B218D5B|nr:hypothetical protein [Anabaena sp. UHCC 0399]MEA5569239.1 hypothetical protein [Anabaena sp. UHCC 0399]
MTATITRPIKKPTKEKPQSPYKRLHVIIPIEDMLWASQQKPSVNQLWQECWTSDPYGSRWMPLSTALGYSSFICAKKILAESGLFIFKPDKSIQDGRETVGWMVRNLHGSRMKEFWEAVNAENEEPDSTKQQSNAENTDIDAGFLEIDAKILACISEKNQSEQAFQKPSRTTHKHLTNSSVEFVRCVSSTPNEILRVDATADAPFGGASPHTLKSVEEKDEELPTVTDCTTLTLVDVTPSQFASLVGENENLGGEAAISDEDQISAAPVVSGNEEVQQHQPTPLLGENEDFGDEATIPQEEQISGAPVASSLESEESAQVGVSTSLLDENTASAPSGLEPETKPDKWSSEALFTAAGIALRSKARPWRMEKLKMAGLLKENPGIDFLMECWNDDPALQIVIKGLVRNFPQWGYVVVDGKLIEWDN